MVNRAGIVVFMSQHILGGERHQATACFLQGAVEGFVQFVKGNIGGVGRRPAPERRRAQRKPKDQSGGDGRENPPMVHHLHALTVYPAPRTVLIASRPSFLRSRLT